MWIATKIVVHVNRNPCDRNIFIFIKLIYFKPKKSTFSTNFSVNFEGTSINIGVFESILVLQHPNRGESRKRLNATGVRYVSIRMNRKPGSKKKRGGAEPARGLITQTEMSTGAFHIQKSIIHRKRFYEEKYGKIIYARFVYCLLPIYTPHNIIIINISILSYYLELWIMQYQLYNITIIIIIFVHGLGI